MVQEKQSPVRELCFKIITCADDVFDVFYDEFYAAQLLRAHIYLNNYHMKYCWKPCGLVSDEHISACSMNLCRAKPIEMVFHSAKTSQPQDSAGYCWDQVACTLFSLIKLLILWMVYSFTLSVVHGTDVVIPGNLIFFSNIFP